MLNNKQLQNHQFLEGMRRDDYYPAHLVEKGAQILTELCEQIEQSKPADLQELYQLSHPATERFNRLEREFVREGSEIETIARECIAVNFLHIAQCYGFADADIEELIAPREW